MTILPKKKIPKDKTAAENASHDHHSGAHHSSHSISEGHGSRSRHSNPILHTAPRSITPPDERHRVGRMVHAAGNIPQSVDIQDPVSLHTAFPPSVVNASSAVADGGLVHARSPAPQVEMKESSGGMHTCESSANASASSKRRHGRISPHFQPYVRGKASKVTGPNTPATATSVPPVAHSMSARQTYIDDRRPISPPTSSSLRGGRRRQRSRAENKDDRPSTGHNSDDEHDVTRQKQHVNNEEIEQKFAEALKEIRGFYIKEMTEDGACLFRAVADQVYGDQNMHDEVRRNCMDYMMKNADYFSNYVTEDFFTYVTRKKLPHTFGNHLEMQAMAEMYNRSFEVFQYSTEPINIFHSSHQTDNDPIRVSYHRNSHYNSVINPYKASVGVGLGLPSFTPGLADQMLLESAQRSSEQELLEQQMLEDKLRAADWENTEDEMVREVAHESFVDYLRHQEENARSSKQRNSDEDSDAKKPSCSQTSTSDNSSQNKHDEAPSSDAIPSTSSSNPYFCNPGLGDWVEESDESAVLAQVLAQSQREYYETLTRTDRATTSSSASCSKYPTDK